MYSLAIPTVLLPRIAVKYMATQYYAGYIVCKCIII